MSNKLFTENDPMEKRSEEYKQLWIKNDKRKYKK